MTACGLRLVILKSFRTTRSQPEVTDQFWLFTECHPSEAIGDLFARRVMLTTTHHITNQWSQSVRSEIGKTLLNRHFWMFYLTASQNFKLRFMSLLKCPDSDLQESKSTKIPGITLSRKRPSWIQKYMDCSRSRTCGHVRFWILEFVLEKLLRIVWKVCFTKDRTTKSPRGLSIGVTKQFLHAGTTYPAIPSSENPRFFFALSRSGADVVYKWSMAVGR